MDIYKREVNSRGQVSEKDSLHATQPFCSRNQKKQRRLKRRSGRAVAHAGLEEEKGRKHKKKDR